MFSCEFYDFFKNKYLVEHLQTAASESFFIIIGASEYYLIKSVNMKNKIKYFIPHRIVVRFAPVLSMSLPTFPLTSWKHKVLSSLSVTKAAVQLH